MQAIIDTGLAEASFRPGVDALELHLQISALCFYVVGNRYTVRTIFGLDMADPAVLARRREAIVGAVLASVRRHH